MSCNETDRIIHTGIASKSKVAELLHEEVLSEPRHLLTPMCESHYRQVHRLLHSDDHMYSDKRCHTCHTLTRHCGGTAHHCPNPAAVNQFFSMNGDTDINITKRDYVCTSLSNRDTYKPFLIILHNWNGSRGASQAVVLWHKIEYMGTDYF